MYRFEQPLYLLIVLASIPLWIDLYRRRMRADFRFSSLDFIRSVTSRNFWTGLKRALPYLRIICLILIAIVLAGPQKAESEQRTINAEGIDVVLVLDISTSMLAVDFKPVNRITAAKEVIFNFLDTRKTDRVGLVVFSGEAYVQCPLTLDYEVLKELLRGIEPGIIKDGTAIGDALVTALNRLRESEARSKIVVLITDGDNNAGSISPGKAAEIARDMGVKIFTIQVGKGGRVPYPTGRDLFGRQVYSYTEIPVNPELLKNIAETTGGEFYLSTDRKKLKEDFSDIINKMEKTRYSSFTIFAEYRTLYHIPLLIFLVLSLFEFLILNTRLKTV